VAGTFECGNESSGSIKCGETGGGERRREVITKFWWGNVRVKRPLGRPRRRWEDYIKMNLQEVGCGDMDWIDVN